MQPIMKQIADLRQRITLINFKEHLTDEDYKTIKSLKNEVQNLRKQLKGNPVALKVYAENRLYDFYLTEDADLCCGDEPTWFDDEVEALLFLDKADLDYKLDYEFEYYND